MVPEGSSRALGKGLLGKRGLRQLFNAQFDRMKAVRLLNLSSVSSTLHRTLAKVCKLKPPSYSLTYRLLGIRNTTTVFDNPARERVRLVSGSVFRVSNKLIFYQPRLVPADGVLVVISTVVSFS